jgi:hypothetical protein
VVSEFSDGKFPANHSTLMQGDFESYLLAEIFRQLRAGRSFCGETAFSDPLRLTGLAVAAGYSFLWGHTKWDLRNQP